MACNICEQKFEETQSVVVSITRSGTTASVFVQNRGKNIILIRRILFCYDLGGGGSGVLYLRPPPDGISWLFASMFLEPGKPVLYYTVDVPEARSFQAQAEYIEIDGRSRSCSV